MKNTYASKYRHCAILVRGGKPIAMGLNKEKQGFTKNRLYENKCIHAELALLLNLSIEVVQNGVVYVGGVTKGGRTNLSKPCVTCQRYLQRFNIKTVFYSLADGSYEEMVV